MTNRSLISVSAITSVEDVVRAFHTLHTQLPTHDLDQFKLFNDTYLVVTESIQQAIHDDVFAHPDFVARFIVDFAGYYFRAVNDSYNHAKSLSPPWAKLNEYATFPKAPVFLSLMLSANAHINNDLPRVLQSLVSPDQADELLADLAKIEHILQTSGKQVVHLFHEQNRLYEFLKQRLQFLYFWPAMHTILSWRGMAFRNYQGLQKHQLKPADVTAQTLHISNRIIRVAKLLGLL